MSSADGETLGDGGAAASTNQHQDDMQTLLTIRFELLFFCSQCNDKVPITHIGRFNLRDGGKSYTRAAMICPNCNSEDLVYQRDSLIRHFALSNVDAASRTAVEALPDVKITKELMDSERNSECVVCQDKYELGVGTKQMPCGHVYHPDCILPWLESHNSCPSCRYELPTDDPNYKNLERAEHRPTNASGERTGN